MEFVKPLDPYTLSSVDEPWRNRSSGVKGHAVPHEAFSHSMAEIVHVIEQGGLTPNNEDLTQLWQALKRRFAIKTVAQIGSPGVLKLIHLEPDSYYSILFTADTAANYTVLASVDNGATSRTDYTEWSTAATRANIIAQFFSFPGDMDAVDVYTGSASTDAWFFIQTPFVVSGNTARRLTNTPRGPVNAINIQTDAAFYAVVTKVL